jgi:hypothetical protein
MSQSVTLSGLESTYLCDKLNDVVYGAGSFTPPTTIYFALFTVMPTASGGGTEVSGTAYARIAVTNNATNFPASSSATKRNGTLIDWGTAGSAWGTVVAVVAFDDATAGNMLDVWELASAVTVLSGGTFSVPVNGLTIVRR